MSKPGTLLCIISLSPHSSLVKQIQLFSLFYKNRTQARRRHRCLKCIPIAVLQETEKQVGRKKKRSRIANSGLTTFGFLQYTLPGQNSNCDGKKQPFALRNHGKWFAMLSNQHFLLIHINIYKSRIFHHHCNAYLNLIMNTLTNRFPQKLCVSPWDLQDR